MASITIPTLQPALERLDELAALAPDWDSYGADPPTPAAIAGARRILLELVQPLVDAGTSAEPWTIGARADGGIMIEWRKPEAEEALEVHIEPDGSFGYLSEDGGSTPLRYREADNVSTTELADKLRALLRSR